MEKTFNYFEAVLWAGIALLLLIRSLRTTGPARRIQAVLALSFAVFAISDVIEADTGAWWEPLWLLAMKGGCILVFALAFRAWFKLSAKNRGTASPGNETPETPQSGEI